MEYLVRHLDHVRLGDLSDLRMMSMLPRRNHHHYRLDKAHSADSTVNLVQVTEQRLLYKLDMFDDE